MQERFELLRSVGEECVLESELKNLVEKKPGFRLYDGFEPSGRMHIAQGIFKVFVRSSEDVGNRKLLAAATGTRLNSNNLSLQAMNVNKCTRAGGEFTFWVADWFALMNDKMGGDLVKIKVRMTWVYSKSAYPIVRDCYNVICI